jgi:branched-chain amino acid transport system substrate-binding protein
VISADHQNKLDVGFDIAKRFSDRMSNKPMPTMVHAGVYAAIIHCLKKVGSQGGNSHDGAKIVAAMKAALSDDPLFGKGSIEPDGRAIHPAYLFKVKKPSESMGP